LTDLKVPDAGLILALAVDGLQSPLQHTESKGVIISPPSEEKLRKVIEVAKPLWRRPSHLASG
jgi:hypothetical protein